MARVYWMLIQVPKKSMYFGSCIVGLYALLFFPKSQNHLLLVRVRVPSGTLAFEHPEANKDMQNYTVNQTNAQKT